MAEEAKLTNEPEVKEVQSETTDTKPAEEAKVETLESVLQPETKKSKPETVPFDVFEMSKKENSKLKKDIASLQKRLEDGASKEEISEDLEAIAEEFNVDKNFLKKIEKSLETKLESRFEERISSKLRPLEQEKTQQKQEEAFNKHFQDVIEALPEFKGLVNKEVIKKLAFSELEKGNKQVTLKQLIEETYGNSLGGKRTIETTVPRGGKEPTEVDFDRARSDTEYFKEIMANPELKAKYNSNIAKRIGW